MPTKKKADKQRSRTTVPAGVITLKRNKHPKTVPWDAAPTAYSPSWGDAQELAFLVIRELGGEAEAAKKLPARCFYALACLAAVDTEKRGNEPLLGAQKVSLT